MAADSCLSASLSYALTCLKSGDIQLKDKQVEALKTLYDGMDVFLWLPTGYGKSICFQALPFLFDHKLNRAGLPPYRRSVCVIVSPLVSLMVDQVAKLQSVGVGCAILTGNSGVPRSSLASVEDVLTGAYSLLFSAPEAIVCGNRWRDMLSEEPLHSRIVAIAVDEAHCVYKWGSDFRPTYARVHELRALVPSGTPMLAATATVTKITLPTIIRLLNIVDYKLICVPPERPNIYLEVHVRTTIEEDLATVLSDLRLNLINTKRILVYCQSLNM